MYRYLKKGELIKDGDEVDCSVGFNEPAKWKKTSCVGQRAPDPSFPSHRIYRRKINPKKNVKYWKATRYSNTIKLIEAVSETAKYVTHLAGGIPIREARESAVHVYCKSREEAVQWKKRLLRNEVEKQKKSLESAQQDLLEFDELEQNREPRTFP